MRAPYARAIRATLARRKDLGCSLTEARERQETAFERAKALERIKPILADCKACEGSGELALHPATTPRDAQIRYRKGASPARVLPTVLEVC